MIDRLGLWAWLLLCAVVPISGSYVPVPLAITLVLCLWIGIRHRPKMDKRVLWPLLVYYLLHLLGLIWTSDMDFGLFDVQVKLGLVLLPIAAAVLSRIHPDLLHRSMIVFTTGSLLAVVLGVIKASHCYALEGQVNCFSQSTLSYDLHPSYTAWYACWVIAYWGHRSLVVGVREKPARIAIWLLIPVQLVWIMMLASKSGVLGLAVVIVFLLVWIIRLSEGPLRTALLVGMVGSVAISAWFQGPLVLARMGAAIEAVGAAERGDAAIFSSSEGSDMRTVAWMCSVDRLRQEPFGAGTGDIKHALMTCYGAKGATEAAKLKLNSHSQFLQGGVALGWPGLLVSVLVGLVPLVVGWRRKDLLLVLFMLLFLLNALVESVLEVQAGVVFLAIGLGLLSARKCPGKAMDVEPSAS